MQLKTPNIQCSQPHRNNHFANISAQKIKIRHTPQNYRFMKLFILQNLIALDIGRQQRHIFQQQPLIGALYTALLF